MKSNKTILRGIIPLFLCATFTICLSAQTHLQKSVPANGAVQANGGGMRLAGTVGQTLIGPSQSANTRLYAGFWNLAISQLTAVDDPLGPLNSFSVFPNPVIRELNLDFSLDSRQDRIHLRLYHLSGLEVWRGITDGAMGRNARQLELPELAAGTYFLVVRAGDGQLARKIMVEPGSQ